MNRFPSRHRQRGIATLLVILLLGVAVGTSALLIWHVVRGTQENQLSVHATTPAQATAWRGVELVRRWLDQVGATTLDAWAAGNTAVPLTFNSTADLGITARVTGVKKVGSAYRVNATIGGVAAEGGEAQARTQVEVVYQIEPEEAPGAGGGTPPTVGTIAAVNIYRDLNLTGDIKVTGGENAVFNVDGNARLDSASITGIDTLRATGDITIGSAINVRNVYANGNVTLSGSASGGQVLARGNVSVSGGSNPVTIRSNGLATFSGGSGDLVETRGGVNVTAGGVQITTIRTQGEVKWTGSGGGASSILANGPVTYAASNRSPTDIRSRSNVVLNGGGASAVQANGTITHGADGAGTLAARGNVTMTKGEASAVRTRGNTRVEGWGGLKRVDGMGDLYVAGWVAVNGTVGGTVTKQQSGNTQVTVNRVAGYQVDVPEVPVVNVAEVPLLEVPPARIDAWPLRAVANYVFEVENGKPVITVANVQGIPNGKYVLGTRVFNYNRFPDWLCTAANLQSDGTCKVPVATICQGFSPQNACFSYSSGKWTVTGQSMARGIAWFNGDLQLGSGAYVNTFIATGSIGTEGAHRTLSPNYAGFGVTCRNAVPPGVSQSVNPDFASLVPTNLCNVAQGRMVDSPLANIAYLAGGYLPSGAYAGGNITLGASTRADGSVLAGNVLNTGGSTTISGAILAGGAGGTQQVAMGGSTTLNLTGGSANYDPGVLPCGIVTCAPTTPSAPGTPRRTTVLWSRYR
jgi:hypothetical protein